MVGVNSASRVTESYLFRNLLTTVMCHDSNLMYATEVRACAREYLQYFPNQPLPKHYEYFMNRITRPTDAETKQILVSCSCNKCNPQFIQALFGIDGTDLLL